MIYIKVELKKKCIFLSSKKDNQANSVLAWALSKNNRNICLEN